MRTKFCMHALVQVYAVLVSMTKIIYTCRAQNRICHRFCNACGEGGVHVRPQVSALLGDMTKTGGSVLRTGSLAYVAQVGSAAAQLAPCHV